jgi:outer membrane protein
MKKFLVAAVMAAVASPMLAQSTVPSRVAVIDVQKVLSSSSAGKAAFERLKKMQEERIEKARTMDEDLRKLEGEVTTKRLSLSEEKIADMQKQIGEKRIAMQRYAQDADREVQEARDRSLLDLNNKIMPVVDAIGKEMGFALIFNKFESGLIYASDAVDITDTVLKRFDSGAANAAAPKK